MCIVASVARRLRSNGVSSLPALNRPPAMHARDRADSPDIAWAVCQQYQESKASSSKRSMASSALVTGTTCGPN